MDLLAAPDLPTVGIKCPGSIDSIFRRFANIAEVQGMIARRLERQRDGCDRLDLSYPATPGVKFCLIGAMSQTIECELVDERGEVFGYDEYVARLKSLFKPLAAGYFGAEGIRPRLGIPRRPEQWDLAAIDCSHVDYYETKFSLAVRDLAIGEGDVRERLKGAAVGLFFVVQTENLPEPLRAHWAWVRSTLTQRPARNKYEGALDATLARMKRSTGAKIAERIVDIADALHRLKGCRRR